MSTTKATAVKATSKFAKAVLAELNKSEQQKQVEAVEEFVETARIDCEVQLGLFRTGELPRAEQKLKKAQVELEKAQKAYEKSRFTLCDNFRQYVSQRESALDSVDYAKSQVANAEQEITNVKAQIATYETVLSDLS